MFKSFKIFYEKKEEIPELVLPIGIPGSGKSTWIKSFNKNNKYIIVSPDEIRKELTGNISDQSENDKVFWMAIEATKRALENGDSVIFDATNVDTLQRRKLIQEMPKNIKLKAKILKVDPEEAKRRIKVDIESGKERSRVPDYVVDEMYKKFQETLRVIEGEGFELI